MHLLLTATSFLVCSKLLLFRYDNEGCSYLYDIDTHIDTSDLIDGVQLDLIYFEFTADRFPMEAYNSLNCL